MAYVSLFLSHKGDIICLFYLERTLLRPYSAHSHILSYQLSQFYFKHADKDENVETHAIFFKDLMVKKLIEKSALGCILHFDLL